MTKSFLRSLVLFQIYNFCHIILYNSKTSDVQKITLSTLICFIILLLCEVLVALGIALVLKLFINVNDINAYNNNIIGYIIIFAFLLILKMKSISRILIKFVNLLNNLKAYKIIFIITSVFILLTTLLYLIYFDLSQSLKLILLVLSFLEYFCLVYFLIISYKNKEEAQKDLSLLLEITSKYEATLNNIKTKNHENKNQLVVIKELIGNDDAKASAYLNSMLTEQYTDDNELILRVSNIPIGGLKGLIYYKLLTMKSKNINNHLEISKDVDKEILNGLDLDSTQSYYKIVGVFLDNAIEAVEKLKKKIVLIELFLEDDYLIFSVSNEFNEKIDFDNLGKQRITTKGDNHGYGLQLVNELVNNHSNLKHQTEIVSNLFVQKIGIKIKG